MPSIRPAIVLAGLGLSALFGAAALAQSPTQEPLTLADTPAPTGTPAKAESKPPAAKPALSLGQPSYLFSNQRVVGNSDILWKGFLNGTRDFDGFANPVGNPLYFESPFANSEVRFLYLWHKFPKGTAIGGGELSTFAAQARLALTDRLAFIATKDGYTRMQAGILPEADGWNDAAVGLKYAFWLDPASQSAVTGGLRWQWHNGNRNTLQGNTDELSPFISFAKGWDRLHLLGNLTSRMPMDRHDGNYILSYDLHLDYEVAPTVLPGFLPLVEFHGLHYLSDGDRLPIGVGGLDYANIGSSGVAGNAVFWSSIGWEWKFTPHLSWAAAYEFPLHTTDTDIFDQRVTTHLALKW